MNNLNIQKPDNTQQNTITKMNLRLYFCKETMLSTQTRLPEWLKGTDLRSVAFMLRGFESHTVYKQEFPSGQRGWIQDPLHLCFTGSNPVSCKTYCRFKHVIRNFLMLYIFYMLYNFYILMIFL